MDDWDDLVGAIEALFSKGDAMTKRIDELEDNLASMAGLWAKSDSEKQLLLGRIEELEAKLAKAAVTLNVIDALDPEGMVNGCSQSALSGLVLRMGELARTTLAELKGQNEL